MKMTLTWTKSRMIFFWSYILAMAALCTAADISTKHAGSEESSTGVAMRVDSKNGILELQGLLLGKKFHLGTGCTYSMLVATNGAVGDLRAGEKLKVFYRNADGVLVADRIEQLPMCLEGRVKSINADKNTVVIQEDGLGLDRQFKLDAGCRVILRDNRAGAPGDIQPGNYVTVTYETPPGLSMATTIAQTSETFTGTVTAIDTEERTVNARSLFGERKFSIGDNCVIAVNGNDEGKVNDLRPDEKLVFTYDKIDGVNVVNHIALVKGAKTTVASSTNRMGID